MYLIVGLGNPGKKYEQTRHNIGYMAADYFAEKAGFSFAESKWETKVAKARIGGVQTVFVKPETYMNNSGRAVGKICSYYKIASENVIVIQDDLDLDLGRVKLVKNRGAGGHNGILSIIQCLGGKDFLRIRAGIGRPGVNSSMPISRFVLTKFNKSELSVIDLLLADIYQGVQLIIENGATSAMNQMNQQ